MAEQEGRGQTPGLPPCSVCGLRLPSPSSLAGMATPIPGSWIMSCWSANGSWCGAVTLRLICSWFISISFSSLDPFCSTHSANYAFFSPSIFAVALDHTDPQTLRFLPNPPLPCCLLISLLLSFLGSLPSLSPFFFFFFFSFQILFKF